MIEENIDFTKVLFFIQNIMNNSANVATKLSFNEIIYDFKVLESLNFLIDVNVIKKANDVNSFTILENERVILRKKAEETIVFANANMKIRYDFTRKSLNLTTDNQVYVRLHKEYTQSSIISRKYSKQRLESVKVLERINKLAYRLDIFIT